ncbi:hypothetical protein BS50DRAFT_333499 [Corynespora cassiicola Philippines]|uniref:Uncharacterized protein n=1 Tax=Corynespora cassiicola Philippines TaxID=1448308 RepID=A0A2T2NUS9_CORCC|nr:hypothetical protein BS50DRAFT_333499 [Corynespora cassiicola Philippines]
MPNTAPARLHPCRSSRLDCPGPVCDGQVASHIALARSVEAGKQGPVFFPLLFFLVIPPFHPLMDAHPMWCFPNHTLHYGHPAWMVDDGWLAGGLTGVLDWMDGWLTGWLAPRPRPRPRPRHARGLVWPWQYRCPLHIKSH